MKIPIPPKPFTITAATAPTQTLRDMIDEGCHHSIQDLHDALTVLEQQLGIDRTWTSEWGTQTDEDTVGIRMERAIEDTAFELLTGIED